MRNPITAAMSPTMDTTKPKSTLKLELPLKTFTLATPE
jgi:hypothetical protein